VGSFVIRSFLIRNFVIRNLLVPVPLARNSVSFCTIDEKLCEESHDGRLQLMSAGKVSLKDYIQNRTSQPCDFRQ
jgi:hypothetical protein